MPDAPTPPPSDICNFDFSENSIYKCIRHRINLNTNRTNHARCAGDGERSRIFLSFSAGHLRQSLLPGGLPEPLPLHHQPHAGVLAAGGIRELTRGCHVKKLTRQKMVPYKELHSKGSPCKEIRQEGSPCKEIGQEGLPCSAARYQRARVSRRAYTHAPHSRLSSAHADAVRPSSIVITSKIDYITVVLTLLPYYYTSY